VEGSTLRKSPGCADDLGIQLRRVGSGNRKTFASGEQKLSAWRGQNKSRELDRGCPAVGTRDNLLASLDLPLNLDGTTASTSFWQERDVVSTVQTRLANRPGSAVSSAAQLLDASGDSACILRPRDP
jgi:hypothetical protein